MKRYVVSADARADLDGIWDYIAGRSSTETASVFLWRFHDAFAFLAQNRYAGVARRGGVADTVRVLEYSFVGRLLTCGGLAIRLLEACARLRQAD